MTKNLKKKIYMIMKDIKYMQILEKLMFNKNNNNSGQLDNDLKL